VRLPSGEAVAIGDDVSGGGGYLKVAQKFGIPSACLPATGEVAVFNPNGDVTIGQ
jgi:hypothetical protein